jgi:hypothetical protein
MSFRYNGNGDNKEDDDIILGVLKTDICLDIILGKMELPAAKKGDTNYALDVVTSTKINGDKIIGAKIEGRLEDHVALMKEKHLHNGTMCNSDEYMILISSFDGAEVSRSLKNKTSIISFSSSLINATMINKKKATNDGKGRICYVTRFIN